MTTPIDQAYKLTKLIKQGKGTMNEEFKQLADWIDQTYGVKTMNIIYDTIEDKRPRLNIIFENDREEELFRNKFGFDEVRQQEIAFQFERDLVNCKSNTKNILIIFSAFEPIAKIETYWSIPKDEIQMLKSKLNMSDLWEIHPNAFDAPTFFFNTNKQAEQYSKNGVKKALSNKYFELLKKYDEFDYFKKDEFSILLDSKEKFDTYYKSNWFYYDRR